MAETGGDLSRLSLRQLLWLFVGTILVLFAVSTAFSVVGRVSVSNALEDLNNSVLPARTDVAALTKAYVDQETGQRGFMLTGDPAFLAPYDGGQAAAQSVLTDLRSLLGDDAEAGRRLDAVERAAAVWTSQAAEPEIAARRSGPIGSEKLQAMASNGKHLFDGLRQQLSSLDARVDELAAERLGDVSTAQRVANFAQGAAVVLVALVVVLAVVLIRRLLTEPVDTVLRDVKKVAGGNHDYHIFPRGPREVAALAEAVEHMRDNLRTSTKRLVEAERRNEQARVASDLHSRTIRRVFGLGLSLSSASARDARDLRPLISETDDIINDLQEIIFNLEQSGTRAGGEGLRSAVIGIVDDSSAVLGFTPSLSFSGPVERVRMKPDVQAAVLTVLREAFGVIAVSKGRSGSVHIAFGDRELRVRVSSDSSDIGTRGAGAEAMARIQALADEQGGVMAARDMSSADLVDFTIPVTS